MAEALSKSPKQLMEAHIHALYTIEPDGRMGVVNEPWGSDMLAPKCYLGCSTDGSIALSFNGDIPLALCREAERLANELNASIALCSRETQADFRQLHRLLGTGTCTSDLCYFVENAATQYNGRAVALHKGNIDAYGRNAFQWLTDEIDMVQPCFATSAWAEGVRALGALPLYSTDVENTASQQVAEKLGACYFGRGYTFR